MEELLKQNYDALNMFLIDRIDAERCYANYDDDDFVKLKHFITMEKDPSEEDMKLLLYYHHMLDPKYFKISLCYSEINYAIKNAKINTKPDLNRTYDCYNFPHSSLQSYQNSTSNWDIEERVDISGGISSQDQK